MGQAPQLNTVVAGIGELASVHQGKELGMDLEAVARACCIRRGMHFGRGCRIYPRILETRVNSRYPSVGILAHAREYFQKC